MRIPGFACRICMQACTRQMNRRRHIKHSDTDSLYVCIAVFQVSMSVSLCFMCLRLSLCPRQSLCSIWGIERHRDTSTPQHIHTNTKAQREREGGRERDVCRSTALVQHLYPRVIACVPGALRREARISSSRMRSHTSLVPPPSSLLCRLQSCGSISLSDRSPAIWRETPIESYVVGVSCMAEGSGCGESFGDLRLEG